MILLLTLLGLIAVILIIPFTRHKIVHLVGHVVGHAFEHLYDHHPVGVEITLVSIAWLLVFVVVLAVVGAVSFILYLFV